MKACAARSFATPVILALVGLLVAGVFAHAAQAKPERDPYRVLQWDLAAIGAPQAWRTTTGDKGVVIAIVDTGIDYTNAEFAGRVILGPDLGDGDDDPMDTEGHGTAVAGIVAAAAGNGRGITGICPRCSLMAVKVFGDGETDTDPGTLAEGIRWATANGADVINLSVSLDAPAALVEEAIQAAWDQGVLVVAAAGNDGAAGATYPAASETVIAVAALDKGNLLAGFSNRGDWVDIAAPGVRMAAPGLEENEVRMWKGTSFAAPIVSAAAGLYLAAYPGAGNAAIRSAIEQTATGLPGGESGAGRINLARLVAK